MVLQLIPGFGWLIYVLSPQKKITKKIPTLPPNTVNSNDNDQQNLIKFQKALPFIEQALRL